MQSFASGMQNLQPVVDSSEKNKDKGTPCLTRDGGCLDCCVAELLWLLVVISG